MPSRFCPEYCSTVWCSAGDTDLKLLGRVVSGVSFQLVACLSVHWTLLICGSITYAIYKIRCTLSSVHSTLPVP